MNNLLLMSKSILLNFKNSPQKALKDSYFLSKSKEVTLFFSIVLAVLCGLTNMLVIKFLPLSFVKLMDNAFKQYGLGSLEKYWGNIYSPSLIKYFFLGIILFLVLFCINALVLYALKTNLFKTKIAFAEILNTCWLPLIPAVVLAFISALCSIFSILLYFLFIALSLAALLIYQYQHLANTVTLSKDRLCFICSVASIIFIIILFKVNFSSAFDLSNTNNINELFKNGLLNSL